MIHYHGTPLTPVDAAAKFFRRLHAMVSFATGVNQLPVIAEVAQSFVLDNGAFTAWKAGNPVTNWKPYYEWVSTWTCHPGCDWALIPDVIDGDEAANDALIDEWPLDVPSAGVPVWHLHESIERLIRLCEFWPRVAFGSSGRFATIGTHYGIYPAERRSIGFLRRGCRLKCSFCVVPKKEGAITEEQTVEQLWRGEPWPRELILLDNDFFGGQEWSRDIEAIRTGGFKVSFNQGINARMLNDETAAAIASVKYRDDGFTTKRLYTAWDSRGDERALFRGLEALVRHGVTPDDIMVYILVGYWPGETHEDRDYRRARLRDFGARPYPMPFVRTPELIGFQRWVIGAYDKRVTWRDWEAAHYRPERLGVTA